MLSVLYTSDTIECPLRNFRNGHSEVKTISYVKISRFLDTSMFFK